MLLTLLLGACLLSFPPINGSEANEPNPDLRALVMMNKGDFRGSGSLVMYQGRELVLTARHVAEHMKDGPIACTYPIIDCQFLGDPIAVGEGKDDDWALFQSPGILGTPALLEDRLPVIGENIMSVGSPMNMNGTHTWGRVSRVDPDGTQFNIDAFGYFGSSGAPVYDADNKVLGIMVAIPWGLRKDTLNSLPLCLSVAGMNLPDFVIPE